ncbi:hypothetical protein GCM10009835_45770 [Planosporangium flavigriseum]|uniref:Uncharacterized protein n=1 Tax=Planosporangium flavigriseum TaxID=373681 RepID=A0A8J3M0F7_9ACTN|nr:hypothetical protein Pfl04_52100 [Planosporangium flavigriseum]
MIPPVTVYLRPIPKLGLAGYYPARSEHRVRTMARERPDWHSRDLRDGALTAAERITYIRETAQQ